MEAIENKHTKVTIIGGGLSGIMAATKITHEFLQKYPKDQGYSLEITLVDPQEKMGGNTYNRYDVNVFMAQPLGELGFDDAGSFLKHMNRVVKDPKATDRTPEFWKRIAPQVPFDETPVTGPDGNVAMGPDNKPKAKGFDPAAYVTHNQYGHYVRTHLRSLREWVEKEGYPIKINTSIDPNVPFADKKVEYIKADAIDAWQEDGKGNVKLSDGSIIESDVIVLATGNVAPRYLSDINGQSLKDKKGYYNLDDAGLAKTNVNEADVTALIGMANGAHFAVLSAVENGYKGKFILCSVDGTTPELRDVPVPTKSYTRTILTLDKCESLKGQKGHLTSEAWWGLLKDEFLAARKLGFGKYDVVDSIAPEFNKMWRMFSEEERLAFRKNHGTEWGHMRYRMPKVHNDAIKKLHDEGRIIYADHLVRDGKNTGVVADENGGFKLLFEMDGGLRNVPEINETIETIGGKQYKAIHVPKIVNNTGPSSRLEDMSPLMQNLQKKGTITQHPLGGVRVDDSLHVIDASGNTQSVFYAIGPITSGEFYEAVTIPAIRQCSQVLGESIIRDHILHNAKDFTPEFHPGVNDDGQIGYRRQVQRGAGAIPSF